MAQVLPIPGGLALFGFLLLVTTMGSLGPTGDVKQRFFDFARDFSNCWKIMG